MKKLKFSYITFVIIILLFLSYFVYTLNLPKWFPFNKENALQEWEEKIFKNKVIYSIEPKQEGGYLSAKSDHAASALLYKIRFNPKEFPMMSWKWQIKKFPQKRTVSDEGWIEKDDYAARVYVIFPSWYFMHIKCIEYIWDENLPEETVMTSPYFHNIKLIVAQSGKENIGTWVFEERNIYKDYQKAFGKPTSGEVGTIALMTDTDNTLSNAEALYKDIKVGYKNEADKK